MDLDGKTMRLALYALGRKARTEMELYEYLERKECAPEDISDVILRLRGYGYLDDAAYAEQYIQYRQHKGGRRKLAYELKKKGIAEDLIETALEGLQAEEEVQSALPYARKALRGETDWPARNRAYAALARRGYASETIRAAIGSAMEEIAEEEDSSEE